MELLPHQIPQLYELKFPRGLEEQLYDAQPYDQQSFSGTKGQYRYLNRPLHRLTDTAHLLYPTIETVAPNIDIPERHMSPAWHYSRNNIPNAMSTPEELAKYASESELYYKNVVEGDEIAKRLNEELMPRPIYDQRYIPGDSLPGIALHNHPLFNPWWRGHKHKQPVGSKPFIDSVEGYKHIDSAKLGLRGYPKTNGYALMGDSNCDYDTIPVPPLQKAPSNLPLVKDKECFRFLSNQKDSSSSHLSWVMCVIVAIVTVILFTASFVAE